MFGLFYKGICCLYTFSLLNVKLNELHFTSYLRTISNLARIENVHGQNPTVMVGDKTITKFGRNKD